MSKKKPSTIEIDSVRYQVVENLGHQVGYWAKAVKDGDQERVAVKRGGRWTWWTPKDRLSQFGSDRKKAGG